MSDAPLSYRIVPRDPHAHLFEVACTVADPDPAGQRFRLPTWIPGSYLIREFARNVVAVDATCNGSPVAIAKAAKDVWQAAPCSGALTVRVQLYAYDLSVRTAYLDATRAYFNGPSVFLCPEGRESRACEVEIVAPEGEAFALWRVATAMVRDGAAALGFGRYRASSYDELIDHPVEIADFDRVTFEAGGVTHEIVVSGRHRGDLERLARDLARICQWQCDLFGGARGSRAPFDRYVFLIAVVGEGYGGLEHRASTSLVCKRDELPQPGVEKIGADYLNLLGLASHEYFHSWNVKRIKPAAFSPYDLARENYTRQLWAFEGITSYYDDLALVRSGVVGVDDFLELVGRTITTVLRTPGRARQSIAESSFDAWIKFYRQDENTPNAVVSYYAKGAVVALALDLALRRRGHSLDQVMRRLWTRHGHGVGVPEGGIEAIAHEIGGDTLDDFFERYVHGTEDPPLEALLGEVGLALHLRAAEGGADRGGTPGKPAAVPRPWLGLKVDAGSEAKLQFVYNGGPAERAGLAAGDTVIAVDGVRVTADQLDRIAERRRAGDRLRVHAFRRDELLTVDVTLAPAPLDTAWVTPASDAADAARARRDAWLGPV